MTQANTHQGGELAVNELSKSYVVGGRHVPVLSGLNLNIPAGQCLSVVGASGSGKTTLLRLLAGLEVPDGGSALLDGKPIGATGRECAIIFQEPRLLPWMTVLGNVVFALRNRGSPAKAARQTALRYVDLVGLSDFAEAYPNQLSGGMAQRVGIARALATQPKILLLDEPLGALDAMTKLQMQEELSRIWREHNVTMVLVTHDLEEAVYFGDRILLLGKARHPSKLIDIPLSHPRERSHNKFVRHREMLLEEFGFR